MSDPKTADSGGRQAGVLERLLKQGVRFELEVAQRCASSGLFVTQSHYYPDGDTWREVDIVAGCWGSTGGKRVHVAAAIECKGQDGDWILVSSESQVGLPPEAFPATHLSIAILEGHPHAPWQPDPPLAHRLIFLPKQGKEQDPQRGSRGIDLGYEATCQAVKATLGLVQMQNELDGDVALLAIPCIVVRSPIWKTVRNDDGSLAITEAQSGWMLTRFPTWQVPVLVRVILDTQVEHIAALVKEILDHLRSVSFDRLRIAERRALELAGVKVGGTW